MALRRLFSRVAREIGWSSGSRMAVWHHLRRLPVQNLWPCQAQITGATMSGLVTVTGS